MSEPTDTQTPASDAPDLTAELARLDQELKGLRDAAKAVSAETDYDGLLANLNELIPEEDRAGLSNEGTKIDQVFARVTAALKAAKRPAVPETDTKRASLTPKSEDLSDLPAHVRMARGYAA